MQLIVCLAKLPGVGDRDVVGDRDGGDVVGAAVGPRVAHISNPASLTLPSLLQVIDDPAGTVTPSGPSDPSYRIPFTINISDQPSVSKAVTDSITLMVVSTLQFSLLL